jgi:ABC-type nitrate/sulfonate/bicarbonate transport system permease component
MPSGGHADRWGFSLGSIVLIILVWLLLTETGLVKGRFFASPVTVAHEFWVLLTDGYAGVPLLHHVGISLLRALAGLLLALVIGVPVGLIIGWSAVASSLLSPALTMFRPVPPIALIPLAVLWFGIGETAKVLLIFLAGFLYVSLSTANAVKDIRPVLVRAAATLGAGRRQVFMYVIFPEALPQITNAIKVGAAISWAVVVAAEMVGAQKGLGYMVMDAATFFRIADVYVGIVLIGVIGFAIEQTVVALERRWVHWAGR